MGKVIENDGTKELFLDFSYLRNVLFVDKLSQLDLVIQRLNIEGIQSYNDFDQFLRNSMIKQAFICLVDDKTRKIINKSGGSKVYDAIIRIELDTISQSKMPKSTSLGFFVNIDPEYPALTVASIFQTRLKLSPQEFETTIKEVPLQIIKFNKQIPVDELLRRNIINSSTISNINKITSTFEQEKNRWLKYLDFMSDLLVVQRKNSLPYLGTDLAEVLKIDKKDLDDEIKDKTIKELRNKTFAYFDLGHESFLKSKDIKYDVVNVIVLDILVDYENKLEKIKKTSELALIPFKANKLFVNNYVLQKNFKTIFDFDFEKNQENMFSVNLSYLLGTYGEPKPLIDYWKKKKEIILGAKKEFEMFEKKYFEEMTDWKVHKVIYEIEEEFDENLFKTKNNYDTLNSGYIAFVGIGEDVLIDRSRQTLKRISEGNTKNPYLTNYLFNTKLIELSESSNEIDLEDSDFYFALNSEQKSAVKKALNSKDIFLLQGPPGTGKTQVICELIYQLAKLNRKVLISSQNHEAIKNVVDRLPYEPNINRIRLTNQLNHKSRSANNFTPERVVYNYYKSITKSIFDDLSVGKNNVEDFKIIENKLEKLLLSSKGYHQNSTQMREIQKQIDEINEKIKIIKTEEIKSIHNKTYLKEEIFNIDNLIEVISNLDFKISINISEEIEKLYKNEISFSIEDFILKYIDHEINEINIFNKLKLVCEETIFKNEFFIDIQKIKNNIINYKREAEFELADKEEQRLEEFEKFLLKDTMCLALVKIFARFRSELENLKLDLELSLKKINASEDNEMQLNSLEVHKNDLLLTRQKLSELAGGNSNELRDLIKFANSKFNLNLGITDVDLEQQVTQQLNDYKNKLEKSLKRTKELKDFFNLVSSYAKNNYGIIDKWDEELATQDFSSQLIQETRRYSSSIINNLVNVYAMTLTSTNLFRFNKDLQAKKMGLEEINLRTLDVDVVIIDEASKATLLEILMPLVYGKTLVLVGDYRQLPPILKLQPEDVEIVNRELKKEYSYQELFELLDQSAFKNFIGARNSSITTMLKTQYRSHQQIMEVVNKFYDNELKVDQQVSEHKRHDLVITSKTGAEIVSQKSSVYWIDSTYGTNGEVIFESSEDYSTSLFNELEIKLTVEFLKRLDVSLDSKTYKRKPSVAVISFYNLHVRKLFIEIRKQKFKNFSLVINTVDDFQGKEADYVIVNMVRNPERLSQTSGRDFLKKYERINVAYSRARELLVIIGASRAVNDIRVQIPTVEDPNISNTYDVYADIIAKINFDGGYLTTKDLL
ncbi:superfamily I DNA/RNA helicase [Spiroplasma helicoides]|uniref:Superfamily I DNA/RNA helicase n=1 Tax=Spiroplasma helicoides TaxID=216938 RepID=A0A1B3SJJ7_9MOLU|nr:AAA domain-containing protein [Spiroplasma helicoides]AOG60102.1 superfamily I DNA/RNA helicase [Spiroplasma helicoides]